MPVNPINNGGDGVAFLVSAGLVYECIAKACSSPQTAELNAEKRAETLMKWVNIGCVNQWLSLLSLRTSSLSTEMPSSRAARSHSSLHMASTFTLSTAV